MKPNWGDAPAWANYLALNPAGRWVWLEVESSSRFDGNWFCKFKREQVVESCPLCTQ